MTSAGIPVERLPDVVIGRSRGFARGEAMALLAASRHPQRESLLAQVLENPAEDRRYRLVAAITLGRVFNANAEGILLRNLATDHPALAEVLQSLGRIGGRDALAAIDALDLAEGHPALGHAAFAAALISYRLRLDGHELPFPDERSLLEPTAEDARPMEVRKMATEPARAVLEALSRYPYGVEFGSAVTRVECDREVNAICVNREFTAAGALADAGRRKALLAMGALQSPETGDYSVSYLFLTSPGGAPRSVDIVVTRCSGGVALAGTGRLTRDRLTFQLRSVRRPGARGIAVRGALANGLVQVTEAASSPTRQPRKVPRRVVREGP